ncbi:MAG: DMT family transporter [Candidatus ainarchaeum sp.]|nr:DMT family transporter [Candidatus ainarchaeum sp.]
MLSEKKACFLVVLTAIISGFSVFLNKFGVAETDAIAFTALKNTLVAVFLISIILLAKDFPSLKSLSKKQWAKLAAIGLIGGSIPFALFFSALKLTSAVNAGFFHKTLFIFAAAFAILFLKEKISKTFLIAAGLLLLGNFLLFPFSGFGLPELLVVTAVIFWAAENVLSKHVLKELNGNTVAFGRMFFGSLILLLFIAVSGRFGILTAVNPVQFQWILLTSIPLLLFVLTFYNGLKHIPVSKATAILMLGQPITMLLSAVFIGSAVSFSQATGIALTLIAILLLFASSYFLAFLRSKGFSLAATK